MLLFIGSLAIPLRGGSEQQPDATDLVTLSIVGTSDLHGFVFANQGRGGLALLGGYVRNLRASRAADGGAVLLIDAGDTYQGGIESNLSEGALVIDAYNALAYTAAAIGNHDFEFGAADGPASRASTPADPRGALKARAVQATFPFLAANLLDASTGKPVDWPNVNPSVLISVAGVRVGIVGIMTMEALRSTLAANVQGLALAPLASTVATEAAALRARGANVVIVAAHAGGRCTRFDTPDDLSSCDSGSEIFQVASSLPKGLVDVIVAGHSHAGLAHVVNGVGIIEPFSQGQAFGRIDVTVNRLTHEPVSVHPFAPRDLCAAFEPGTDRCAAVGGGYGHSVPAQYEGRPVTADSTVLDAMAPALRRVRDLRATPVGVVLETPFVRAGDVESPLGNLFADAMLAAVPGADVAINNNGRGGLRTDLPAGPLLFGALYDAFPFDNRLVQFTVAAGDLKRVFEREIRQGRRNGLGISGLRVRGRCSIEGLAVDLLRSSGRAIDRDEPLVVVTMDQLAAGGLFGLFDPVTPGVKKVEASAPLIREIVADWLRRRGGVLRSEQFLDNERPRWEYSSSLAACAGH